jgi:hypothetical protein
MAERSGERHTLSHDFVIIERVDHHEIQIGVLIKPAMDKRAASEKEWIRESDCNLSFSCSAKLLCKSGSVFSILFPVHKKDKALQNIERFISRPDISAGTLPLWRGSRRAIS